MSQTLFFIPAVIRFMAGRWRKKGLEAAKAPLFTLPVPWPQRGSRYAFFATAKSQALMMVYVTTIWWISTFTGICINCQCSFPPAHYGLLRLIYWHSCVSFGYMMILMFHF